MRATREADAASAPMRAWRRALLAALASAYAILWVGGVASHWLRGGVRADDGWLASLFLFLAGAIVLAGADSARDVRRLACVALLGFAVEVAGVHTGVPFGAYSYTEALTPRLFGVPLVMLFAWMSLVAYAGQATGRLAAGAGTRIVLAALWVTAIDLVIDPLAANRLGYWRWDDAGAYYGIPATNFAGWFATGLLAFCLFRPDWRENRWARFVGLSITLFFTLVAAAHGLSVPALVGVVLVALHLLLARAPKVS